jgi:hypothetical protein
LGFKVCTGLVDAFHDDLPAFLKRGGQGFLVDNGHLIDTVGDLETVADNGLAFFQRSLDHLSGYLYLFAGERLLSDDFANRAVFDQCAAETRINKVTQ